MKDYKKKYLKYKNKYFKLINKTFLSGGANLKESPIWLNLRFQKNKKFKYDTAHGLRNIMKTECSEEKKNFGSLNENLLGFLFWLDTWHDFFQGRAKVDIRDTQQYQNYHPKQKKDEPAPPDKTILTKTSGEKNAIEPYIDKKETINTLLQDIFPGKHKDGPNSWKDFMTNSIPNPNGLSSQDSFEKTVEHYIEKSDCFNYIGCVADGADVFPMTVSNWKLLAEDNNILLDKINEMLDTERKILIFEYDEDIKEILRSIKNKWNKPKGDIISDYPNFKKDDIIKIIKKIQIALIKFLNITEDATIGIDAGSGQIKAFLYDKLVPHTQPGIKKLVTPQIMGDSAVSGGAPKTSKIEWGEDLEKKNNISNIELTLPSGVKETVWELHSTVCTSPHFIRWFYRNSSTSNPSKGIEFELWVTPSSNIGNNNSIISENNLWKAYFKNNMNRGLSVKELSLLIEQTANSKDIAQFEKRISTFFTLFSANLGTFDIKDILINLSKWGKQYLSKDKHNFWIKPANAPGSADWENVQILIVLFLLDFKRGGDYEQVYSAKFLIKKKGQQDEDQEVFTNLSTTGDIIAGLVYRILQIPLYSVRGARDIIFSTGKQIPFSEYIKNSMDNLNKLLDKFKVGEHNFKIFKNCYIDLRIQLGFGKFHLFTIYNIRILRVLFNELGDKSIKDMVEEILKDLIYLKLDNNKIKEKNVLNTALGDKKTNLDIEEVKAKIQVANDAAEKKSLQKNLEDIKKTQKEIKEEFNKIKNKLNKLFYLYTFTENWGTQEEEATNSLATNSLANFLGLSAVKLKKLEKSVSGTKPSIEFYFNELQCHSHVIQNVSGTKVCPERKRPLSYYETWHSEDGTTNVKKVNVRAVDGRAVETHNHFEKHEFAPVGNFWKEGKNKLLSEAEREMNIIQQIWEGNKHTLGLKDQCANIIDKNIVLFEAVKLLDLDVVQRDDIITFLNNFKTFITELNIEKKYGFFMPEIWVSIYNPIFTTHFTDNFGTDKLGGEKGIKNKDFTNNINQIRANEKTYFKENSPIDFTIGRISLPLPVGGASREPINIDFWYEASFSLPDTRHPNPLEAAYPTLLEGVQGKQIEDYIKGLWRATGLPPLGGGSLEPTIRDCGEEISENRNLNFKIDSHSKTNNTMIGGHVNYSWLENSNPNEGYEYLKDNLAYNILDNFEYTFNKTLKTHKLKCQIYDDEYTMKMSYLDLQNLINDIFLDFIYFVVDYEPLSDFIDLNLLFEPEYDIELLTAEDITLTERTATDNFINDYIKTFESSKSSRRTKNDIKKELDAKYDNINFVYFIQKFNMYIKNNYLDENIHLLLIYYLVKISDIYENNKKIKNIFLKLLSKKIICNNELFKKFLNILFKILDSNDFENPVLIVKQFIVEFYINLSHKWINKKWPTNTTARENLQDLVETQLYETKKDIEIFLEKERQFMRKAIS